jgi:hypothetical protein
LRPLIFIPKVRNIEKVVNSWDHLPYDKLVVENFKEEDAYHFAKYYFLLQEHYTHLVICPDDLVIDHDAFEALKRQVDEYDLSNLSGIANHTQGLPDDYCCQKIESVNYDYTDGSAAEYYTSDNIPSELFMAGFTGFCCQWIDRELMSKITFNGTNDRGNSLDWQFARELYKLEIPLMVYPDSKFEHLSKEQRRELRQWVLGNETRESSVRLIK